MTTATETQPLHLARLEIESFMRVSTFEVDANGRHVIISAKNGSGKSSVLSGIFAALQGFSSREIPEPIHKGDKKAVVRLDLGEFTVERHWTEKGTRLVVTAADGSKVKNPPQLLESLLGKFSLDPVAFLERREQDQIDDVLAAGEVPCPVDKVQAITGDTIAPKEGESADKYLLRLSADETGTYYHARRDAGRVLDGKQHALTENRRRLQELGGPLAADERESSIADTFAEVDRLQGLQAQRDAALAKVKEISGNIDRSKMRFTDLQQNDARLANEIKTLQQKIADLTAERQAIANKLTTGVDHIAGLQKSLDVAREQADVLPDQSEKIKDLRFAAGEWERTNAKIQKRKVAGEQVETLARETAAAQHEHQRLDGILQALRDVRAHLLDGVDLGCEGLTVGDGELRLNGVSFKQAGQAEKLRVACAVAMKQHPRLRILRVDDGEALDAESKQLLLDIASRNGFQVIMACVGNNKKMKLEFVEAYGQLPVEEEEEAVA